MMTVGDVRAYRSMVILLQDDLVDSCKAGDDVVSHIFPAIHIIEVQSGTTYTFPPLVRPSVGYLCM